MFTDLLEGKEKERLIKDINSWSVNATIDIDGNVGEIDGIKYKIAGAAKNKMDIVLV